MKEERDMEDDSDREEERDRDENRDSDEEKEDFEEYERASARVDKELVPVAQVEVSPQLMQESALDEFKRWRALCVELAKGTPEMRSILESAGSGDALQLPGTCKIALCSTNLKRVWQSKRALPLQLSAVDGDLAVCVPRPCAVVSDRLQRRQRTPGLCLHELRNGYARGVAEVQQAAPEVLARVRMNKYSSLGSPGLGRRPWKY